jgi:hypothetical protein
MTLLEYVSVAEITHKTKTTPTLNLTPASKLTPAITVGYVTSKSWGKEVK